MPVLSVIIPVYNVAPYLRACLNSVRVAVAEVQRVRPNFTAEMICVDDGSTDDSGRVLDEYVGEVQVADSDCKSVVLQGKNDPRTVHINLISSPFFHIIHQKNAGVSVARNVALDVATGEWVMMLDGDDTWASDLLIRLLEKIDEHSDCDAVCFGMVEVDERKVEVNVDREKRVCCVTTGNEILLEGRGRLSRYIWSSCDKIFRRSVIEQAQLRYVPNIRVGEDSLFSQMFFAQSGKVVLDGENEGYHYLMKKDSAIHQMEQMVPDELFPKFLPLYELWRRIGGDGLKTRLQLDAAEAPFVFKEARFADIRSAVLDKIIDSETFNKLIIQFLIFHGRIKSRLFACVYLCLSRKMRKRLILASGN